MSQTISQLPVGAKVKDTNTKYYDVPIEWMVLEHDHDGVGTTTLLTEKIISLKAFDAKEPNNSNNDRKNYGNNRYAFSNILHWLNSEEQNWYRNMHSADQAPNSTYTSCNAYDEELGFLNGFSYGFKKILKTVGKITARNTVTDSGGNETVYSKIFLLSNTEVGLANENSQVEGTLYSYFNSNNRRKATCTSEAISHSNYSSNPTVNDNWYWWLRTPDASTSNNARTVYTDGTLNRNYACRGNNGVRPACSIPSDTLVSDDPDSDGYYTLILDAAPQTVADLPIGAVVVDSNTTYYNSPIQWKIIGKDHDGQNTVTLLTKDIISLKCFDAKESSNSNSLRKSYGNNRYSVSNIRQWLNSDAAAGGWYSAQHSADAPPNSSNVYMIGSTSINPYDSQVGFLNGFSADFKALLQDVTKIVVKNTVTDDGGSETVTDRVFLLSETEVGLGNENSIAEGTIYDIFNDDISRLASCTSQAITNSNYTSPTVNDNWYWFLRTPYASNVYKARSVDNNGTLANGDAFGGDYGVRPACSIPSTTGVEAVPDSDGVYTIVWNSASTISPSSKSYSTLTSPFSDTFTITDPDGDTFTGTVTLDSTQIQSISGTSSTTVTVDLTSQWASLAEGSHTLTISVTDSNSETTTETYTFSKLIPHPGVIDESIMLGIANAIRSKTGESGLITPMNMASAISGIVQGDETHGAITLSDFNNMSDTALLALDEGVNSFGTTISITESGSKDVISGDTKWRFTLTHNHLYNCSIIKESVPDIDNILLKSTITFSELQAVLDTNSLSNRQELVGKLITGLNNSLYLTDTYRIIGIDHDGTTNTVDLLTEDFVQQASSGFGSSNRHYDDANCYARIFVEETFYNGFSSEMKEYICPMDVVYNYDASTAVTGTTRTLTGKYGKMLSYNEVGTYYASSTTQGHAYVYCPNASEGTVYEYFNATGDALKTLRIKKFNGNAVGWWLRSRSTYSATHAGLINSFGNAVYSGYSYTGYYFAPALRISNKVGKSIIETLSKLTITYSELLTVLETNNLTNRQQLVGKLVTGLNNSLYSSDTYRIIGVDHDGTSNTVDLITEYQVRQDIYGARYDNYSCNARIFAEVIFYSTFDSATKENILPMDVVYYYSTTASNTGTEEVLTDRYGKLLSFNEVGTTYAYTTSQGNKFNKCPSDVEGTKYEYFNATGTTLSDLRKKNNSTWFLRTRSSVDTGSVGSIDSSGNATVTQMSSSAGLVPCIRIGIPSQD